MKINRTEMNRKFVEFILEKRISNQTDSKLCINDYVSMTMYQKLVKVYTIIL